MVSVVAGGMGSIKVAIETVGKINSTFTEVKVAEAKAQIIGNLIAAQQALLDAQETLLADTDTIRALEAEIVQLKNWNTEAERYETADTGQGALAYRLKGTNPDSKSGEWLCPNCFQNRKKSMLIPEIHPLGRARLLRCHPCKWEAVTHGVRR